MFKFGDTIKLKKPPFDRVVVCGVPGDVISAIKPVAELKPDWYLVRQASGDHFEVFVIWHVSIEFELDEG